MKVAIAVLLCCVSGVVVAQVRVGGYVKKDGTYVAPYVRTAPDNTISNNYSTKGNFNPYTGKAGTVADPAQQDAAAIEAESNRNFEIQRAQQAALQEQLQAQRRQADYELRMEQQAQQQRQLLFQQQQIMQQNAQPPLYNINGGCNPRYPASCIK